MNNDIAEDYVSFEVAQLLKEKGFGVRLLHSVNETCQVYDEHAKEVIQGVETNKVSNWNHPDFKTGICSRPTQALAVKWLYENFRIWIGAIPNIKGEKWKPIAMQINKDDLYDEFAFNSPQEAINASLEYTLKNLI